MFVYKQKYTTETMKELKYDMCYEEFLSLYNEVLYDLDMQHAVMEDDKQKQNREQARNSMNPLGN